MAREDEGRQVEPGLIARVSGSLKYLFTGTPPSEDVRGELDTSFFGPGKPLREVAPQAKSRQFDYPVAYNLAIRPRAYEGVTFDQLRALADGYDLLRLVIETRKDQIEGYEWSIFPKEGKSVPEKRVEEAKSFFRSPDKEHSWSTWLRMLLEDLFVIDAVAIYPRYTAGGKLYSLELIDGATIKRVLDATGRTPLPPEVAYQQVLKGLPAVDYTRDELIYVSRNPRTNRVYGFSPVEQIIMTVNIALRRQITQLNYFTEGNIPEAIAGLPESWNIDQVAAFQRYWDSLMEGNLARKRHVRFVPFDASKISYTKQHDLKDMFDEWLARIVCFAFSISPTMLVKETNRATADTVQETAKAEGTAPLLTWLKSLFDFLLAERLGYPDLEFQWKLQKDLDPVKQATVDEIYLRSKVVTPDEIRERLGLPKFTPEQRAQLNPSPSPDSPFPSGFGEPSSGPRPPVRESLPSVPAPPPGSPQGKAEGEEVRGQ